MVARTSYALFSRGFGGVDKAGKFRRKKMGVEIQEIQYPIGQGGLHLGIIGTTAILENKP
jgi:hypothetical protein